MYKFFVTRLLLGEFENGLEGGVRLIEVKAITKAYRNGTGVFSVTVALGAGRLVGVFGRNGSGKSTFLKIVGGYLRFDSGEGCVCGFDLAEKAGSIRACTGFMPEYAKMYNWMTAGEYIDLAINIQGRSEEFARERLSNLIDEMGVLEFADVRTADLSKGMLRKLLFVIAMSKNNSLFFLDEPFDGIDQPTRMIMEQEIVGRVKEGALVLCVGHDIEAICRLADEYIVFGGGRLLRHGMVSGVPGGVASSIVDLMAGK